MESPSLRKPDSAASAEQEQVEQEEVVMASEPENAVSADEPKITTSASAPLLCQSPAASSPNPFSLMSDNESESGSPAFVLATPPRLLRIDEESEEDTPIASSSSSVKALLKRPADWNKENVPIGGGGSGYKETPTNSRRGRLVKLLSEQSSTGCSPAFDNLMKRPLAPINEANGFSIKRPRREEVADDRPRQRKHNLFSSRSVPAFSRSFSETAATMQQKMNIIQACNRADTTSNLTADFDREQALPLVTCGLKHQDLPTIDCHTLAKVIRSEFAHKVDAFRILDARYKYEFEGGHIVGAENFGSWGEKEFNDEFLPDGCGPKTRRNQNPRTSVSSVEATEDSEMPSEGNEDPDATHSDDAQYPNRQKREILIFHCEFSSARGPALMRQLRARDREVNKCSYPKLYYPETYLLHEGYKVFYENYPELCEPRSYQPMKDPKFSSQEKNFRKKSKSWAAGGASTVARTAGVAAPRMLKM